MTTHSEPHTHTHTYTHTHTAEINELAEPQRREIATHTLSHTHTLTHIYTHAHKRAAEINEKVEPDASAAVYPALFLPHGIMEQSPRVFGCIEARGLL